MSFRLPAALAVWAQPVFTETFCREVAGLPHGTLPLQQAMSQGSHVADQAPSVVTLSFKRTGPDLAVRAGVFFQSMIAGCNCADDPSPADTLTEYCELLFLIDTLSAETRVSIG